MQAQSLTVPWPAPTQKPTEGSLYRKKFRAGAKLDPRRLLFVEVKRKGRLGGSDEVPNVEGLAGTLDNAPWKDVTPPKGTAERAFIREIYKGADVGPYRALRTSIAVVPHDIVKNDLVTSKMAGERGYKHLASWLEKVENLWKEYGKGGRSFLSKIDFYGQLTAQFPIAPLRIVFASSGSQPTALLIESQTALIDYSCYWMPCTSRQEGYYLCAVINSEAARKRAEKWQAEGQGGKRHFDKAMFNLPIPLFNPKEGLHLELAAAAMHAEFVASRVEVKEGEYFVSTRNRIRRTLIDEGIAGDIEKLVEKLLGPV